MNIRNRVKDSRRVKGSSLRPHASNWRTHPPAQRDALKGLLAEIGMAGALLVRELPDGTLGLIDGHLRAEELSDNEVPVLVLDVDEAEANKLLATYDPLGAMAEANADRLKEVMEGIETQSGALRLMLEELAARNGMIAQRSPTDPANDPNEEWKGMPGFECEDQSAYKVLPVHFQNAEDLQAFANLIGQPLTEKTRAVWYPEADTIDMSSEAYADDT